MPRIGEHEYIFTRKTIWSILLTLGVVFLLCVHSTIQGTSMQETKSTFLPIFSNLLDLYPEPGTSRYVRLTCPGCFPQVSYERILTEEILVMSKGRFRGRRYVKKNEGLKTNFEIIVPMNPCVENKFKMRLQYTDDSGEIQETSQDGTYRKEACDIDPTEQLPETILLYTGINHEANNFNMHISLSLLFLVLLVSSVLVFFKMQFMTGKAKLSGCQMTEVSNSVKDVEIVLMTDRVAWWLGARPRIWRSGSNPYTVKAWQNNFNTFQS